MERICGCHWISMGVCQFLICIVIELSFITHIYIYSVANHMAASKMLGNNLMNLSRCPPNMFQWKTSTNPKSGGKHFLNFVDSSIIVGSYMMGTVARCNLRSKVPKDTSFQLYRSQIVVVPIETEWERLVSVLTEVKGSDLVFQTLGKGVVIGTIPTSRHTSRWFQRLS
jgi:hypothetical protein